MCLNILTLLWRSQNLDKLLSKSSSLLSCLFLLTCSRLAAIEGEWHEFESKALRKENERKDKEARRQAQKEAAAKAEKEKKRGPEVDIAGDAKRVQMGPPNVPVPKVE